MKMRLFLCKLNYNLSNSEEYIILIYYKVIVFNYAHFLTEKRYLKPLSRKTLTLWTLHITKYNEYTTKTFVLRLLSFPYYFMSLHSS